MNTKDNDANKSSFRAMVLAAGVGSRLDPISSVVPKPLVPIGGRPVMEHIMRLLKKYGAKDVISNTHHLADSIHKYFNQAKKDELAINLEFVHEPKLSGAAGGIRQCAHFLKQGTACIIMGDALTDLNLGSLYNEHKKAVQEHGCLVTIAKMQVEDSSQFGVIVTKDEGTDKHKVLQFQEKPKAEEALSNWANTGIYFFEPEVYDFIPSEEDAPFYDVAKDLFPKLMSEGKYMQAVAVDANTYWAAIGNPKQYLQSMQDIVNGKVQLDFLDPISKDASIDKSAKLIGINEVGNGCIIEEEVVLDNCLLWDNVTVQKGAALKNCILSSGSFVEKNSKLEEKVMISENHKKLSICS